MVGGHKGQTMIFLLVEPTRLMRSLGLWWGTGVNSGFGLQAWAHCGHRHQSHTHADPATDELCTPGQVI